MLLSCINKSFIHIYIYNKTIRFPKFFIVTVSRTMYRDGEHRGRYSSRSRSSSNFYYGNRYANCSSYYRCRDQCCTASLSTCESVHEFLLKFVPMNPPSFGLFCTLLTIPFQHCHELNRCLIYVPYSIILRNELLKLNSYLYRLS